MSSRHQPLNGADSEIYVGEMGETSEYLYKPFRVLVEDNDGGRVSVTVTAMGRNDARNLAFEKARDLGWNPVAALRIEAAA